MSHHGLQVLYTLMNADPQWACERAFTPLARLRGGPPRRTGCRSTAWRRSRRSASSTCIGFSLQYEVCYTNILTMLDLGGIPLHAEDRGPDDPLVIAGGPGAQNPELLAPFVDLFVIGDGEPSLPVVCEMWKAMQGDPACSRDDMLARIVGSVDLGLRPPLLRAGVPRRRHASPAINRTRADVPGDDQGLHDRPTSTPSRCRREPVVPFVETPHDRIAIEIMRGCPWQCRFCQTTVIKRPLRVRTVETIVKPALESYRNTGYDEISLLSLSTSDYPHFEELVTRMHEVFTPAGREHLAAEPADQPAARRSLPLLTEGRRRRADAGPRGGPRRHARADPQADQERGPVRGLPRGVQARLAAGEALLPVRPARRAAGRPRRHRRDGRDDRPDRQGGDRPLRRGRRPACRTSCPSRTRRTSGTACRRASTSAGPATTCARGSRSAR